MFDAFCSIIRYNGLMPLINRILMWAESEGSDTLTVDVLEELTPMHNILGDITYDYGQLDIIWMVFVIKFGNYGTSPRYGWLSADKKKDVRYFCYAISDNNKEVW